MRALAAALILLAGACARRSVDAPRESDVGRFPHAQPAHAALACTECHAERQVLAGTPARPGANDHAPCDRGNCHAQAFLGPPSVFCSLCHQGISPWLADAADPAPYPPRRGPRAWPAEFSHALHLDTRRMDQGAGFHVSCGDCHGAAQVTPESAGALARRAIAGGDRGSGDAPRPGHAACLRCHDEVKPLAADCAGCHRSDKPQPRQRRLIRDDLDFAHALHTADAGGRPIPCVTCHTRVATQRRTADSDRPSLIACVTCHDDTRRTPATASMRACATCHARAQGSLQRLVTPRSHVGERFRPDDHTIAFRRDHAREAEADASRCARCHGGMSGQARDNCNECHDTMRPADHGVAWREYDHGPEAAASAERCAVCHDGESCTACHTRRPRSHSVADFAGTGHGQVAQFRLRSCLTCHAAEVECAMCHTGFSP